MLHILLHVQTDVDKISEVYNICHFFSCDYQFASTSFPLRCWWGWEDKGKENVSMKEKVKINIEAEKVQLILGQHWTNRPSC